MTCKCSTPRRRRAAANILSHRGEGDGGYGQNIAMWGTSGDVASVGAASAVAQAVTNMWFNGEIGNFLPSYYGLADPPMINFENWGHYSQVVWKGSTDLGCAVKLCQAGTISPMDTWFTVCNYYPPGKSNRLSLVHEVC